jgi:tRNA U34 5-carboxymethylaminomethyl modifying GTPase MnmE/TrmE
MTEQDKRAAFNRVKGEILAFIEEMRKACPEAAKYLEEHMVYDEHALTMTYTGDDRLKMTRMG